MYLSLSDCREYLGAFDPPFMITSKALYRHTLLSRFFPNVTAFRTLQAQTHSLIAGRAALNFFDRSPMHEDPLDVVVYVHHCTLVAGWLVHEGYVFQPTGDLDHTLAVTLAFKDDGLGDEEEEQQTMRAILVFEKLWCGRYLTVRVIIARRTPAEVVLNAHSTCLLNIISYEKAYCLYPRATLHERTNLLLRSAQEVLGANLGVVELADVLARGYHTVHAPSIKESKLCDSRAPFILGRRWINDFSSWVIDFDVSDIPVPNGAEARELLQVHDPVAIWGDRDLLGWATPQLQSWDGRCWDDQRALEALRHLEPEAPSEVILIVDVLGTEGIKRGSPL
ncbi:hypothetical protein ACG7TL_001668 [Trametes sanguinea]